MNMAGIERKLTRLGMTRFQKKVLMALCKVPKGETITYKELAKRAGYPDAYRAVGSVMRINPMAPTIPCHRVIKSNGSIGNYSGKGGVRAKRRLLEDENIALRHK